jgi:hypothetical protein
LTYLAKTAKELLMNSIINLSATQLRKAAELKDKIQSLETEIGRIFGSITKSSVNSAPKKKFTMSAAGRAKVAAAQRARWAKIKGTKPAAKTVKPAAEAPAKRKMSAAARAKLSAMAKARWAKAKKAGKKTL